MTPEDKDTQALEAAGCWGKATQIRPIKQRENAVYELTLPEIGRAALRIHRSGYQSEAAIWSELWWLDALAEKGLPVPRPLMTSDGSMIAKLPDGRSVSLLTWVEGRELGQDGTQLSGSFEEQTRHYARLGQLLAEIHATTDHLKLPPDFQRPSWGIDGLLGNAPLWGRFWEHPNATPGQLSLFKEARSLATKRLADYTAKGADQGLIHADVLRENVLVSGKNVTLIDFDDCGFGFRLYDLGTAIIQNLAEPNLSHIAQSLCEGYSAIRLLSEDDVALLPWFVLLRSLASVGWTISRLPPGDTRHQPYITRAVQITETVLNGRELF